MMRILKGLLPNITIVLNLALGVVYYLDMRNPMMGFLVGAPFVVLVASTCICSIATAIVLFTAHRKSMRKLKEKTRDKTQK